MRLVHRTSDLTGATLFTGGGGADLGMVAAGLHMVWGVEYDAPTCEAARINGIPVTHADVTAADPAGFEPVLALHASPPCPNFSAAKVGAEETEQDMAIAEATARFIERCCLKVFTLENVWAYRNSRSWEIIRRALDRLGFAWNVQKLNSADYGVPQTRERMIVIAVRGGVRPSFPTPTHAEKPQGGGLFESEQRRWVGWYEAIEDILDTLPESRFAPWQMKRLPEGVRTMLMMTGNTSDIQAAPGVGVDYPDTPANTVCASTGGGMPRAMLVNATGTSMSTNAADEPAGVVVATAGGKSAPPRALLVSNAKTEYGDGHRQADDPASATTLQHDGRLRALLVDGDNAGKEGPIHRAGEGTSPAVSQSTRPVALLVEQNANETSGAPIYKDGAVPHGTVRTGTNHVSRALLVDGKLNDRSTSLSQRDGERPALTITTSHNNADVKAAVGARVVQMTPRALARFQSFPDTYVLPESRKLACRIIGNAAPPLLMQRVYEDLIPQALGSRRAA